MGYNQVILMAVCCNRKWRDSAQGFWQKMVPLFFLEAHTSHVLLFYTGMGCPPDHGLVSLQLKAALNNWHTWWGILPIAEKLRMFSPVMIMCLALALNKISVFSVESHYF